MHDALGPPDSVSSHDFQRRNVPGHAFSRLSRSRAAAAMYSGSGFFFSIRRVDQRRHLGSAGRFEAGAEGEHLIASFRHYQMV